MSLASWTKKDSCAVQCNVFHGSYPCVRRPDSRDQCTGAHHMHMGVVKTDLCKKEKEMHMGEGAYQGRARAQFEAK